MAYKSSPRGARAVRLIVLHTTEGALTAASLGAYFYRPDVQASSHVGIGTDGVKQYVSYSRSAWTVRSGNAVSDNAELCGFAHWTRAQWLNDHRKVLDLAADWVHARCVARGIPRRKLTTAQVAAGEAGVIGHWDWTVGMHDGTHTDPGTQFPWDYVMNRAAAAAPGASTQEGLMAGVDEKWLQGRLNANIYDAVAPAREAVAIAKVNQQHIYAIERAVAADKDISPDEFTAMINQAIADHAPKAADVAADLVQPLSEAMLPDLEAAVDRLAQQGAQITGAAVVAELSKTLAAGTAADQEGATA